MAGGNESVTVMESEVTADNNSGWACVIVPDSQSRFGTGKPVRVAAIADGHEFDATLLPIGDGRHMLPMKAAVRKAIGKGIGDTVRLEITGPRS